MRKYMIVDIDGTVAKIGERLEHITNEPRDWDKFFDRCDEDEPIRQIIDMVTIMKNHYEVVFCTGRSERVREKTMAWIQQHLRMGAYQYTLLMRPLEDYRHDVEVKPEQIFNAQIPLDKIAFVLEDRNTMVKKWRELGLTCLQVADGDF